MSRTTIILIIVLSAGVAGLLVFSNLQSHRDKAPTDDIANGASAPGKPETKTAVARPGTPVRVTPPAATATIAAATNGLRPLVSTPVVALSNGHLVVTNALMAAEDEEPKSLPDMEKGYTTTTNRETRLDFVMDIAEVANADAIRVLTRLFEVETDTELKVDILDSLLGIDGYKDEKLIMLTLGTRAGLPNEVRQTAVDGLIDLEDTRAVAILNGLLNDPDEEIREAAKDAIEMLQTPPIGKLP